MRNWLISQTEVDDYDTYDSAVVVAATEDDARRMHPGYSPTERGPLPWPGEHYFSTWTNDPAKVTVVDLGESTLTEPQVVCASFNAG